MSTPQRYLVLPARGLQATAETSSVAARDFLLSLEQPRQTSNLRRRMRATVRGGSRVAAAPAVDSDFEVVASLHENGIKLVSATPEMAAAMRFEQPGLRIVPEVFYKPAVFIPEIKSRPASPANAAAARTLDIEVVGKDGAPIAGVTVIAFIDFAKRNGLDRTTKASGKLSFKVPAAIKSYERLYVQHDLPGLWSYYKANVSSNGSIQIVLESIDLSTPDSLRHFHDIGKDNSGQGVRVAVIDSGVALDNADLQVSGGLGCVPEESENDYGPTGGSHGTHVAGIIAGRGKAPSGMRGIAPAAEIFSYRVFGASDSSGSNFAIVKAIERAVADGCDLLNLSLGFDAGEGFVDEAVQEAIRNAHKNGVIAIAAAGNDGRQPVNYPASDDLAIAVSAVGCKGTFPTASGESADVMAPYGTDKKHFVAAFSNIGTELDVAGAGVGVVSTVPGGYAPMSGTSMACPAVTGVLARLLAANPQILSAPRDSNRADAIKSLLFARAKSLGFKLELEGKGLPK